MELSEIYTCLKELSFYNHNEVLTGVAILVSLYAIKKTVDLSRKESNNRIIKLKYDSILQLMIFADDISLEINRIEQEEKELKEMLNKIESKIKESNDDYLLKIKNDILS